MVKSNNKYGIYLTKIKMKRPRSDSELYTPGEDYWNDANVNWDPQGWDLYAWGYREAADILVKNFKNANSDTLIYPIVFLYRQTIELQLKDIISTGMKLSEFNNIEIPTSHNLVYLWDICKKIIKYVWSEFNEDIDLNKYERIIKQINEIDKKSDSFRYPVNTNSEPSLPYELQQISITHLSNKYKELSDFLNGCIFGIAYAVDIENDMKSESMY